MCHVIPKGDKKEIMSISGVSAAKRNSAVLMNKSKSSISAAKGYTAEANSIFTQYQQERAKVQTEEGSLKAYQAQGTREINKNFKDLQVMSNQSNRIDKELDKLLREKESLESSSRSNAVFETDQGNPFSAKIGGSEESGNNPNSNSNPKQDENNKKLASLDSKIASKTGQSKRIHSRIRSHHRTTQSKYKAYINNMKGRVGTINSTSAVAQTRVSGFQSTLGKITTILGVGTALFALAKVLYSTVFGAGAGAAADAAGAATTVAGKGAQAATNASLTGIKGFLAKAKEVGNVGMKGIQALTAVYAAKQAFASGKA